MVRVGIDAHKKKCVTQIFDSDRADQFNPTDTFTFPTTMEGRVVIDLSSSARRNGHRDRVIDNR